MNDQELDQALIRLNSGLQGLAPSVKPTAPARPLFILGLPRSGTTLATQLIASNLNVGYISNITATTWSSLPVGALLHRTLLRNRFTSNFSSLGGRTTGPAEPHEAGRYWLAEFGQQLLSLDEQDINQEYIANSLRDELSQLQEILGTAAFVAKSFLVPAYVAHIAELIPAARFLWLTRPASEVERSLASLRRQTDRRDGWLGVRPQGWRDVDVSDEISLVSEQVHRLESDFKRFLSPVEPDLLSEVPFRHLVESPREFVQHVAAVLDLDLPNTYHLPAQRGSK